jgi:phosphoribosyl-AMP cyclohydrolase
MTAGPDFAKHDLIPAIAQDADTGDVLMMAWMNREAYEETLSTGRVCYYSRSRNKLWRKGEESGNVQELRSIYFDCDADTILVKVNQIGGAACHEGYRSCFFRRVDPATGEVSVEGERVFDPADVYNRARTHFEPAEKDRRKQSGANGVTTEQLLQNLNALSDPN